MREQFLCKLAEYQFEFNKRHNLGDGNVNSDTDRGDKT